jgi:hypothetical protein
MAIKPRDIPCSLVERLEASHPESATFYADETDEWPEGIVPSLIKSGLLQETRRATALVCDGCNWSCDKPVIVRKLAVSGRTRAFIQCDEEPNLGRIQVPMERLRGYRLVLQMLDRFIQKAIAALGGPAACRSASSHLGLIKGRYGMRPIAIFIKDGRLTLSVGQQGKPLAELLLWSDGKVKLDLAALRRLANRKETTTKSADRYSPNRKEQRARMRHKASRDRRIFREASRLHALGHSWSAAAQTIAKMEFVAKEKGQRKSISASRVRRIICEMLNR